MVGPFFAMPPPGVLAVLPIGLGFVLLFAYLYVTTTARRSKQGERDRRVSLGLAAILCGPVVGATLVWLRNALGYVHPADLAYEYTVFTVIGSIAGFLAAVVFGITGLLAREKSVGKGGLPDL